MRLFRNVVSTLLVMAIFSSAILIADVKITSVTKTSAFMGRPAKTENSVVYICDTAMYTKASDKLGILYDGKTRAIYFLLKENEQYMEVDWKKIKAQQDAMADFMKNMKWELKNTGKKEKVGEYDTTIWKLSVKVPPYSEQEMTFYMYEKVKLPKVYENAAEDMLKLRMAQSEDMMKQFKQMNGITVKMLLKVKTPQGDLESVMDVTNIEFKDLKKSLFEIPQSYRKIDFDLQKLNQFEM